MGLHMRLLSCYSRKTVIRVLKVSICFENLLEYNHFINYLCLFLNVIQGMPLHSHPTTYIFFEEYLYTNFKCKILARTFFPEHPHRVSRLHLIAIQVEKMTPYYFIHIACLHYSTRFECLEIIVTQLSVWTFLVRLFLY